MRWTPYPQTVRVIALWTVSVLLAGSTLALAQENAPAKTEAKAPDDTLLALEEGTYFREPAAPESVLQRIDSGFGTAVDWMATVLFYRVGTGEQLYVQFDEKKIYVRVADSKGEFQRLLASGIDEDDTLTSAEVDRLDALGKLEAGSDGTRRSGELGEQKYEFIVESISSSKYVLDDGKYKKVLPKRSLLSDEDVLSDQELKAAAARGALKVDDKSETPFILKEPTGGIPVVVLWLATGAVFFTIYMRFFNFWGFTHAVAIVRGKYDDPNEPGEVTHFQALASALSATVGLGNIAGVTIAMTLGGPGAFFWMLACGFFGMTSKFVECTLGQRYREVKKDGTILGGPMQYLHRGLAEINVFGVNLGGLGFVLAIIFAVMCILASFGGGNMFQANQSGQQMLVMMQRSDYEELGKLDVEIKAAAEAADDAKLAQLRKQRGDLTDAMQAYSQWFLPVFGCVLAVMVGAVIIGGIKRIGAAASKIVPTMCLLYLVACIWIIVVHITEVPAMVALIFTEAFNPKALSGGLVGVLVIGVQRAAFSNEAGVGSASIAHSAAKTEEPVREGSVALLGPFIDTIVVCSMTALVVLITGAWDNDAWIVDQGLVGTPLTSKAFESEIWFFPYILSIAVVLFAYSTIVSWSYYGEKCWERLFGARSIIVYRLLYVVAAFVGAIVNLGAVLDFSDMMILSMAFPNIFGLVLLSPKVRADLLEYWQRHKDGKFKTYK